MAENHSDHGSTPRSLRVPNSSQVANLVANFVAVLPQGHAGIVQISLLPTEQIAPEAGLLPARQLVDLFDLGVGHCSIPYHDFVHEAQERKAGG